MATLLGLTLLVTVAAAEGGTQEAAPAIEVAPVVDEPDWDGLAECESNRRWHVNSGNGYYGGLQEDLVFWRRYGGLRYASRPDLASREAQISVARVGQQVQGWSAWPVCSRRVGLR